MNPSVLYADGPSSIPGRARWAALRRRRWLMGIRVYRAHRAGVVAADRADRRPDPVPSRRRAPATQRRPRHQRNRRRARPVTYYRPPLRPRRQPGGTAGQRRDRPQASILGDYFGYLRERWNSGCTNAAQLWQEIRDRGYPGSCRRSAATSGVSAETRPSPPSPAEGPGRDRLDHDQARPSRRRRPGQSGRHPRRLPGTCRRHPASAPPPSS